MSFLEEFLACLTFHFWLFSPCVRSAAAIQGVQGAMTEAQGEQGEGESINTDQSVAQEVGRVTSGKLDVSGLRLETSSGEITANVSPKASTDNLDVLVDATMEKLPSGGPGIVSCAPNSFIEECRFKEYPRGSDIFQVYLWENMFGEPLIILILHQY